jgi:pilus assembly protein Flp/PilA
MRDVDVDERAGRWATSATPVEITSRRSPAPALSRRTLPAKSGVPALQRGPDVAHAVSASRGFSCGESATVRLSGPTGAQDHCTRSIGPFGQFSMAQRSSIVVREATRSKGALGMIAIYLRVAEVLDREERGQGLAEYALILALIAIVAIVALIFLGGQVSKILSTVGKSV